MTKEFIGDKEGKLKFLKTVNVKWEKDGNNKMKLIEKPNSLKVWPCELALLALGFSGPEPSLSSQLKLELDKNSNIKSNENYQTNIPHIFSAGDVRRGQSLIVWAISEGREAAYNVDRYLMGSSNLPLKEGGDLPIK